MSNANVLALIILLNRNARVIVVISNKEILMSSLNVSHLLILKKENAALTLLLALDRYLFSK